MSDSQILTGLGITTHPDSEDIGVSPGASESPYTTDLGSWMPCPFHISNTENANGDTSAQISPRPDSLLPFLIKTTLNASKQTVPDTVTIVSPFSSSDSNPSEQEKHIMAFNSLRSMVTCGVPSLPQGTQYKKGSVNFPFVAFGNFSSFLNSNLDELTFDPANNKITMTSAQSDIVGHWVETGHYNGYGSKITIVKTMKSSEDSFPDDYYGTYRIIGTADSNLSLLIDSTYKSIPGNVAVIKKCKVIGDSWLMNHAGYNAMSTPFPGLEPSYNPDMLRRGTEIVQDGGDPNPADANWNRKDDAGNADGWTEADPPVYENDEVASLINTLTGEKFEAGKLYRLQFTVAVATLSLKIGGGTASGSSNLANEYFTVFRDNVPPETASPTAAFQEYSIGTHEVHFRPTAARTHLWITANTDSAGNGTIDDISCSISGYNSTPYEHGYRMKNCFKRTDAVTTMYMPFDGTRGATYQSRTGRTANHRVRDVRYKASDIINGIAVIGNVDTLDDKGQTFRERNRIMWSTPMAVDEFGFFRSKMIGVSEPGGIVSLKSFNGSIFCIKTSSSYILDPNQGFAEQARILGAGADWASCVCRTPFGVIVGNKKGIYALPNKDEITLGIRETYRALNFNNPTIGFSAKHNELVLIPDTSALGTEMWVFDFSSQAWSKITYTSGVTYSNLLYGGDNELLLIKETRTLAESSVVLNGNSFTGWTVGANWNVSGGVATHSTGATNTFYDNNGSTITAFAEYQVNVITTSAGTAGKKCAVSIGGVPGAGRYGYIYAGVAGTQTLYLQAGSTTGQQVMFAPETDYDGAIDMVSAFKHDVVQSVVAYSSAGSRDNTKMTLHTKDFIFNEPNASKYVNTLSVTYQSLVGITVYIYVNNSLIGEKQLPINRTLRNRKIKINQECESISFKFESDNSGGTDDNFKIEDMTIEGWYNDKK